ncbi:Tn3 family transposase [Mesorhizobium caraganae]|uniref:Tn3 family transposase n=1 Tax=Mesorhizobium caraganae TaxID=483206 RepID=UPI001552EE84
MPRGALEAACGRVANATQAIRNTPIWGESGTACASESKKLGAWDGNLMTEWHVRYGGRGVMTYWHVEKGSTCIFSQLKRCSSSEVAAMIKGVLRPLHQRGDSGPIFDSHGQSAVVAAFCRLLGFTCRHARRRSPGRSWRRQACALNCPICFPFFPTSSTERWLSSSMATVNLGRHRSDCHPEISRSQR